MSTLDKDFQALVARFEKGVSADPTENMSAEDTAKWKAMNEEHGDKFKTAVKTFAQARADIFDHLRAEDWTVQDTIEGRKRWAMNKTELVAFRRATHPQCLEATAKLLASKGLKVAAVKLHIPAGTRVVVDANPVSRMLYSGGLSANGTEGTVTPVSFGGMKRTFMPGPGGGMVYVKFDDGSFMGVSTLDLNKASKGKTAARSLSEIAREIRKDWKQVNYAAKPYLDAMSDMDSINDNYGYDSGKSVVLYFLNNAGSWRGEVAKRVKAELKAMTSSGRRADDTINLLAALDLELTASEMPGVALDKDAAALDNLAHLAALGRVADQMIGKTILEQMGGARRLQVMLGVQQFISLNDGIGIKWPNKNPSKGNYVEIRLNGSDLYDVTFFNAGRGAKKLVKKFDDIFFDDLVNTFERQTGWYLRMASAQAHQLVKAAGAKGPDPRGHGWKKKVNPTRWNWSDRESNVNFTVNETPSPGIMLYTLRVLTDHGMFKHTKPAQWRTPEEAFRMAAKWFPGLAGETISTDMTTEWSKVGVAMKSLEYTMNPGWPKAAGEEDAKESKFEEGVSADPTKNMSPEDAAEWKKQNEANKNKFKKAFNDGLVAGGCPDTLDESEKYKDQAKTAYEEGSRVPDGWDNGHIEGKEKTDEPGEEGSDTPDGNGNQQKRADKKPSPGEQDDLDGEITPKDLEDNPPTKKASSKIAEVVEEMYALVSTDGYMLGATDDWSDARSKSYWRYAVDDEHLDGGSKLMTLVNVPLALAEKFKDMGTSAQWYSDGYAAWVVAHKFTKGSGTRLAKTATISEAAYTAMSEDDDQSEYPAHKEAASGLYGHTKHVQADCESCVRKVQRTASSIARNAYGKHQGVAEFLATHARRADSLPAQILVAALKEIGPKVASMVTEFDARETRLAVLRVKKAAQKSPAHAAVLAHLAKTPNVPLAAIQGLHMATLVEAVEDLKQQGIVAFDGVKVSKVTDADAQTGEDIKQTTDKKAAQSYGLYGFGEKVAGLGLQACSDLRHQAGKIAYDLHRRRANHHAAINDFFANHSKKAKCMYSKLLAASYPEPRTAAQVPRTVQGWLAWVD